MRCSICRRSPSPDPMKTILFSLLLVAGVAVAAAQQGPKGKGPGAQSSSELAALEQFLGLSDAELAQMEQVIARIRAMTPAERVALREQIAAFRRLPEGQRQQMRQGWGGMPPEYHDAWREMMQGASAQRHAEIQSKMQSLPVEERLRYRRELVEEYLKAKAAKK